MRASNEFYGTLASVQRTEQMGSAKKWALAILGLGVLVYVSGFIKAGTRLHRKNFTFKDMNLGEKLWTLGGVTLASGGGISFLALALVKSMRDLQLLRDHQLLRAMAHAPQPPVLSGESESSEPGRSADRLPTSEIDFGLSGPTPSNEQFEQRIHACEPLVVLRARFASQLDDRALRAIAQHGSSVKRLEITECKNFIPEEICAMLDTCDSLRELRLRGCRGVNEEVLKALSRHHTLEVIDLTECGSIECADETVQALALYHPTLRELRLPPLSNGVYTLLVPPNEVYPFRPVSPLRILSMEVSSSLNVGWKLGSWVIPWNRLANLRELRVDDYLEPLYVPFILNSCRKLRHLSILEDTASEVDPEPIQRHDHMRSLTILHSWLTPTSVPSLELLGKLPRLEELSLHGIDSIPDMSGLPSLRKFVGHGSLSPFDIQQLCEQAPHLREAHIGRIHRVDEAGIGETMLPRVRHHEEGYVFGSFDYDDETGVSLDFPASASVDERLHCYINRWPNPCPVAQLSLGLAGDELSFTEGRALAARFPHLRHLDLWEGGRRVPGRNFTATLAHFAHLEQLTYHIHDWHQVRCLELFQAVERLPTLRRLVVIGLDAYSLEELKVRLPHLDVEGR